MYKKFQKIKTLPKEQQDALFQQWMKDISLESHHEDLIKKEREQISWASNRAKQNKDYKILQSVIRSHIGICYLQVDVPMTTAGDIIGRRNIDKHLQTTEENYFYFLDKKLAESFWKNIEDL